MSKLTVKQEKFCQAYIETGNASEAYRVAYSAQKMTENTLWANASRVLKNSKVLARVKELQEANQKAHSVTVESLRDDALALMEAAQAGVLENKAGAFTAWGKSIDIRARLYGLYQDKVEVSGEVQISASDVTEALKRKHANS